MMKCYDIFFLKIYAGFNTGNIMNYLSNATSTSDTKYIYIFSSYKCECRKLLIKNM